MLIGNDVSKPVYQYALPEFQYLVHVYDCRIITYYVFVIIALPSCIISRSRPYVIYPTYKRAIMQTSY